MMEPDYIAQTFEREHTTSEETRRAWFSAQTAEAKARGAIFGRFTVSDDYSGLLIEAWKTRPIDQGYPRWMLAKREGG